MRQFWKIAIRQQMDNGKQKSYEDYRWAVLLPCYDSEAEALAAGHCALQDNQADFFAVIHFTWTPKITPMYLAGAGTVNGTTDMPGSYHVLESLNKQLNAIGLAESGNIVMVKGGK